MKRNLSLLSYVALLGLTGLAAPLANAQSPVTQRFTADLNGARIAYTVTGSGPETILLIHGYPLNGDLFTGQRRALSASNRVITIDLRGFGNSVAPDDQGSIDLYATDVLALMDQLGITRAIIGGHSMGGAITLRLYQRAPERFRGMILNDAAAFPPPTAEQFLWRGYQQQSRERGADSLLPLLLPEFVTGRNRTDRPNFVVKVANMISAASLNGLVGGARALETRPDLRPVFPTIAVPTLILFGQEDSLTSIEQAQTAANAIPGSTLAIIPGTSHGVIREGGAVPNDVILGWLSSNFR